ncbi:phage tail protein [Acidothermaceae bacterium B102]|nr:phage tail protein [Acidothermaceae bacterium B102]
MTRGWLVAQLPRAMAVDPVLTGLVEILETVADTLVAGADALECHLDIATASPPMLRYLASWLDADLDPSITVERQREVLLTTGSLLGWRGTRRGLESLLAALTGARVEVADGGGVFTRSQPIPPANKAITVRLDTLGELNEGQVRALIEQEVPVGTRVELVLAYGAGR